MDCRISSWIPGIGYTYSDKSGEKYVRDFLDDLELEMASNRFSVFFCHFKRELVLCLSGIKELNGQFVTILKKKLFLQA